MLTILAAVLVLSGPAPHPADTLEVGGQIRSAFRSHTERNKEHALRLMSAAPSESSEAVRHCSPDRGDPQCFFGPLQVPRCTRSYDCRARPEPFIEELEEVVEAWPTSGTAWLTLVHFHLTLGQTGSALARLAACQADGWLCMLLRATALAESGDLMGAETVIDEAWTLVPEGVRCEILNTTGQLGRYALMDYEGWPRFWRRPSEENCPSILRESERIYWLGDPLWIVAGNDRRTVAVQRGIRWIAWVVAWSHADRRGWHPEGSEYMNIIHARRGPWDSYELVSPGYLWYTSRQAARYHFLPDFESDQLNDPVWTLDAGLAFEGYTPPYAPFVQAETQIARFRADSAGAMQIAVAGTARDAPVDSTTRAHLILSDAPDSFPLVLESPFMDRRVVFLATTRADWQIAGLEAPSDSVVVWHREAISPLPTTGTGISDLLLYRPTGLREPGSTLAAVSLMHPTEVLDGVDEVGLYWEAYAVPEGTEIRFQLEMRSGESDDPAEVRIAWSEPSSGEVHRTALTLATEDLAPGAHVLTLTMRSEGAEVSATRVLEVR